MKELNKEEDSYQAEGKFSTRAQIQHSKYLKPQVLQWKSPIHHALKYILYFETESY